MLSVCFVDADAAGGGDGQSWAGAYQDLQSALSYARSADDVDQIWIAEGVYKPSPNVDRSASFYLADGVTLHGGFAGTESTLAERDPAAHVTTLSGDLGTAGDNSDNAYTVVYCGSGVSAGLEGLTISGGNADAEYNGIGLDPSSDGGGIFNKGTLTVTNCMFVGNTADYGGAIMNDAYQCAASLTLTNSVLMGNSARSGAGVGSWGYDGVAEVTITNSTLTQNSSETGCHRCGRHIDARQLHIF